MGFILYLEPRDKVFPSLPQKTPLRRLRERTEHQGPELALSDPSPVHLQ
jgi:hypothetical protein